MPRFLVCACLVLMVLVAVPVARVMPQAPATAPALDLVPVNVYVLDKAGKPVTDLKQSDFVVAEDGLPQTIRSFTAQSLAADASAPAAPLAVRKGLRLTPQRGRVFAIMLGLGRLEGPSAHVTALIDFVKNHLLPQDQVAIFAYDRAMAFTSDHQAAAAALERFKKSHEDVDFSLGQQMGDTGMAPLYGKRVLPAKLQTKIDELLLGPGAKPATTIATEVIDTSEFAKWSLDDFMTSCATTLQDQGNLMALVEYLRRFEGEKHVIFVTEKGFPGPSDENDRAMAAVANDARVSIHTFQAGGVLAAEANKEMNATVQQARALRSLRTIAELTGGVSVAAEKGQSAVDRLDDVTRHGYVIGYQAMNSSWDSRYRTIAVRVNRPDVTVLYRHGYNRDAEIGGFSRRAFIAADRISQAGNFRRSVSDIKIKATGSQGDGESIIVKGQINLAKVTLATVNGSREGVLDVAVFGFDRGNNPMGALVQQLDVKMSEADYARYQKDGYPFTIQFAAIRGTQNVRFIVYDFGSDMIGRADLTLF
jgi:VWFA-related protein